MKRRFVGSKEIVTCAALLLGVVTINGKLNAQEPHTRHAHYKVIDLGTFGGPHSQFNGGSRVINRKGMAVGGASTSIPDPLCTFDYPYCFIFKAGKYDNGSFLDLGSLPGGANSFAIAINSNGVATGGSENGLIDPMTGLLEDAAVIWKNGTVTNLGTLGGPFALAVDINDRELVVGGSENTVPDPDNFGGALTGFPSPTQWRATLWERGVARDLGTLGTGPDAFAGLTNSRNQITGLSYTNSIINPETGIPTVHPFLWENGRMRDLGSLGGAFAASTGLNDSGQVVGNSNLAGDLVSHPFIWDRESGMRDLGTFGGDNGSSGWINDAGHVVGEADFPGNSIHHGFLWINGRLKDLKPVGSDPCSNAFSINSSDQAVGNSTDCHGTGLAAVLWENGTTVDLSSFIPPGSGTTFTESVFISDRGEIAVSGIVANGDVHGFILVPDGDCNSDCERRMSSYETASRARPPVGAAKVNDAEGTLVERFRNMMQQRYHATKQPDSTPN